MKALHGKNQHLPKGSSVYCLTLKLSVEAGVLWDWSYSSVHSWRRL